MTTKRRFRAKYRLEIRERDHGPAHCHLVGADTDIVIYLTTLETDGAWPRGLRQEVMVWIEANRKDLIKEWRKWHP